MIFGYNILQEKMRKLRQQLFCNYYYYYYYYHYYNYYYYDKTVYVQSENYLSSAKVYRSPACDACDT